jgi:arabinogalactan oligomer/maltooligosaccharide transport system substrate-binding protein
MASFSETRVKVVDYIKEHKALTLGSVVVLGVAILLLGIISSIGNQAPPASTTPPVTPPIVTPTPPTTTPTTPTTPPAGTTVELNWWGGFMSEADMAPLIQKYEAANTGVKINYSNEIIRSSDIAGYRSKLKDAVGDENNQLAPDIFIVDNGWVGSFMAKSEPAPADVYTASSFKTAFHDFVSTDFVSSDKVYGAPMWVDNLALIYNKKLWKAAGLTEPDSDWNTFANDQVPDLTKKADGKITQSGFAGGISANSEFWFEAMNMLMLQNKVALGGTESKLSSGTTAKNALDFYRNFGKGSKQSWTADFNPDVAAFLEGRLATYLAPSWRLNDIVRYNEAGELGLEIGVMEVPQLQTATDAKSNIANYWGFMVNGASTNADAAWDFLKFLTEEANIRLLHDTVKANNKNYIGTVFPLKSLISSQSSDPYLGAYAKALSYTKSWFMVDEDGIRKVYKDILDNNKDLKSADTEINKVLKGTNGET